MNRKNIETLASEFPDMVREESLTWRNPFDEIRCEDGWFKIIYGCLLSIAEICKENKYSFPIISCIKEKFGRLRIYADPCYDFLWDPIDLAERLSGQTCEICGAPGVLRQRNWIKTLCDLHAEGCPELKSSYLAP